MVNTCQVGGGGWPATDGRRASIHAQEGAFSVQIVISGRAISGLSNVPARTNTRCGLESASLNRCVPHSGQKRRCILFPLSATL